MQDSPNIFLADAIEQVVMHPAASHAWHNLNDRIMDWPTAATLHYVEREIGVHTPSTGIAGFLRETFLAGLTQRPQHTAAAARLALDLRPADANRLMAFATVEWGMAVVHADRHGAFVAALRDAELPAIMERLGTQVTTSAAAAPPRQAGLRKVAVLAPHLGHVAHPPTCMALEQVRLLVAAGLDVTLYSCQELQIPQHASYLGCGRAVATPLPDLDWLGAQLPAGASAHLSDVRLSMGARWREMLRMIHAEAPDLVLLVGMTTPLAFPLYAAYPVVALNVHAVAPMAPVDVWLTADAALAGRTSQAWGDALPPAFGHHHPFRVRYQAPAALPPRAGFGLDPDDVVLVTVGSRLPDEIHGAWAEAMLDVMRRHPRTVWLLVGGTGTLPAALRGDMEDRVRCLRYTNDVASVLALSDIYVNPPRVGGGLSAAEAMAQGLPVVALADGDAGAKLGAAAQPDDAAYFAHVAALLADPALRAREGQHMREVFRTTLDLDQSTPSLLAACFDAMRRHALRQSV